MSSYIYINSADRISGSIEDFSVFIQDHLENVDKNISVESLAIPYSYYVVNGNNNTLLAGPTGVDTITLTQGNYTGSELSTELQTQLNAVLVPTYTVSFDSNSGKFTYSTGDASEFQIITDTQNYKYLGFDKSSTNSSSSGSLTSSNVIDVSGSQYIEVRTDLPIHSENNSNLNRDVLLRVYPNSEVFSTIFYQNNNAQVHFTSDKIQRVRFTLFDEFDNQMDLNGLNWSLTLKVSPRDTERSESTLPHIGF